MTHENFNALVDKLEASRVSILKERNAKYSHPDNALYNFNEAAKIMGCTPAQAAWNYATKHIIALRDMILKNDFSDIDDLEEKIRDVQNYLTFIWALGNEESDHAKMPEDANNCNTAVDITEYPVNKSGEIGCENCRYGGREFHEMPCRLCKGNYFYSTKGYENIPSYYQEKLKI